MTEGVEYWRCANVIGQGHKQPTLPLSLDLASELTLLSARVPSNLSYFVIAIHIAQL